MSTSSPNAPREAIVIGGGFAGQCAARALSEHVDRVTIIEKDTLPVGPDHRKGVPQSHHVHAMLMRGLHELESFFPGFEADMERQGAHRIDLGADLAHYSEWGWAPRATLGLAPLAASRLLFESTVRERVRRLPNVRIYDGVSVKGLRSEKNGNRVRVVGVDTDSPDVGALDADLVVDAAGRGSRLMKWLKELGLPPVHEEFVDAYAAYASRFYKLSPNADRWWKGMWIDPAPPDMKRWGLLMPIEGERRYVLTLGSFNRDYPPNDEAGFEQYMRSLRSPALADEIADAVPLSDIHSNRSLFNRARHYHRYPVNVEGLLAMGDGVVAFNATHGQGMSMAAASASVLDQCLGKIGADPVRLPRYFQKAQWKVLYQAWELATGMDFQWPETEGKQPLAFRLFKGLAIEGTRAAHEDPELKKRFLPVLHLMRSPYTQLMPDVVARILWASLRRRLGSSVLPAELSRPQLPAYTE